MRKLLFASLFVLVSGLLHAAPLFTLTLGADEVTAIQDTSNNFPASLFPDDAATQKLLREIYPRATAPGSTNVFLIKLDAADKQKESKPTYLLIDTGYGNKDSQLIPALDSKHVLPSQIAAILITHLHSDHIGGLLDNNGRAVFPYATVWISTLEFNAGHIASAHPNKDLKRIYEAYKRHLRTFEDGTEVFKGITAHFAVGHTVGHATFQLGNQILFVGDLLHAAAWQFPHPELCTSWDADPKSAVANRTAILDSAVTSGIKIAGAHLPYPGIGIVKAGTKGAKYDFVLEH